MVLALLAMAGVAKADGGSMRGDPVATTRAEVVVHTEPGLEAVGAKLEAEATDELASIAEDLPNLPAPAVVHIEVVRDASSLPAVAPGGRGAPPWAIGVAYPDVGQISIALRRGAQVVDAESTLKHELAHLALGAALGDRAPHWLHEGFAYQHSSEWSWDRAETLAGMVWFGGVIPIEDLDRSFPAEESPANRAYAESYDFVGYLARRGVYEDTQDDGDRWPFRRFLAEIAHGKDVDAAAVKAFGRPISALFAEWRDSLSKRYLYAPIGLLGLAVWVLCGLLLTVAWWRRRRINRRRIAEWDEQDRAAQRARDEEQARFEAEIAAVEAALAARDELPGDDLPN